MRAGIFLAVLLAGCASVPGLDISAEQQTVCRQEKCLVLTAAQLKSAIVHFTQKALAPAFEAGMEEGAKSCKRTSI